MSTKTKLCNTNMEQQNPIVKWPYGMATILMLSAVGVQALAVNNNMTIVDGVSVVATDDRTLDITADPGLEPGAVLLLKTKSVGTEELIPGIGVKGETITGVAGKTQVAQYIYDGSYFIQTSDFIQID